MCYSTVLVHLDFDGPAAARLRYASDLAGDLDALLIGFSATHARIPDIANLGTITEIGMHGQIPDRESARFEELQRSFFSIAGDGPNSSWRQEVGIPTDALLRNSRAADLVVSGTGGGSARPDRQPGVDAAELVCSAGRPVLFVGADAAFRHPETALVGWKDTPESRRALFFACRSSGWRAMSWLQPWWRSRVSRPATASRTWCAISFATTSMPGR